MTPLPSMITVKLGYSAHGFSRNLYIVIKFKGFEEDNHLFPHLVLWNLDIVDRFDILEGLHYIEVSLYLEKVPSSPFLYLS